MAKSFSELQTLAIQIRDELNKKKNSAQRVGSALLDIIDNCIQNITDIKQKLSVFEHACSGFKRVSSEVQLPVTPSQEDLAKGFLVNTSLYLYVGTGGNAVNGRYFNVGDIRGPQGEPGSKGETGNTGPTGEKGEQGNSGVTGDTSDIVVINNLDGGESEEGSIKVLAAEQGKVLNKKYTELENETNKNVFTDHSDVNEFIKEIYLTGWDGISDMYLSQFTTNPDGTFTVRIHNIVSETGSVCYTYTGSKDGIIRLKESEDSGISGYILVDTTKVFGINASKRIKLTSKCISINNSPIIKGLGIFDIYTVPASDYKQGGIDATNGSIVEDQYQKYVELDLYNTDILQIEFNQYRNNPPTKYGYAFLDIANKVISYKIARVLEERIVVNKPKDAAKLRLSWTSYKEQNIVCYKAGGASILSLSEQVTGLKNETSTLLKNCNQSVFTNNKAANLFVKEIYLTGWDGSTDLYLSQISRNEDGTFAVRINNADDYSVETEVCRTYSGSTNGIITLVEVNNSGISGYIVIDTKNYFAIGNNFTEIGERVKITDRCLSLNNCPILKNYFNSDNIITLENLLYNRFNVSSSETSNMLNGIGSKLKFSTIDNSLRIVASGDTGNYECVTSEIKGINLKKGHKYGLFISAKIDNHCKYQQNDFLRISLRWSAGNSIMINFGLFNLGIKDVDRLNFTAFLKESMNVVKDADYNNCKIGFLVNNNTKTSEEILDITIRELMIVDITDERLAKSAYNAYYVENMRALCTQTGIFDKLSIVNYANSVITNSLYEGMLLRSLGDSLPETQMFQPLIADCFGMTYPTEIEVTTEDVVWNGESVKRWRSVLGGTCVAPIITDNQKRQEGMSVYMRAKSLKYYYLADVLIILAGYNDTIAGQKYISNGTSTQPDDYGIDDEPYVGDEINLVENPEAEVPSFGACYRGMIENILTDNPACRIILCGVPRGDSEAGKYGQPDDWNDKKNAVIEKIAKEYGFPFVNLANLYGVNKFNSSLLTRDLLHFGVIGGKRVAMEIIAKAF